jgi:hypothetical protein
MAARKSFSRVMAECSLCGPARKAMAAVAQRSEMANGGADAGGVVEQNGAGFGIVEV